MAVESNLGTNQDVYEYQHIILQNEDEFHLKQALLRSTIRISDGRAKPIDLLAKYISAEGEVTQDRLERMIHSK